LHIAIAINKDIYLSFHLNWRPIMTQKYA